MELQRLTVINYAETADEKDKRITLSPSQITLIAADVNDVKLNGRELRHVTVLFLDGASVDLLINNSDLNDLEGAVGSYFLGYAT